MPKECEVRLLECLVEAAAAEAERRLGESAGDLPRREMVISDLELSPLVDKQLIAAALRLSTGHWLAGDMRRSLLDWFRVPAPAVAVDAQRRAIEKDIEERGLPMELAKDYVATLERRAQGHAHDLPDTLWSYASIYDDLWCDPRIGARSTTRRIMLAMATALRVRSAQLIAAKVPKRAALPTAVRYGQESDVPPEPIGRS